MQKPVSKKTWTRLNTRRVALIHKKYDGGLAREEEEELERLQELAYVQVAALDEKMLDHVARMEAEARRVLGKAGDAKNNS